MKSKINYSSPEYQLEKLKNNHLIIEDETGAIIALKFYGYSNLIKSYRDPYVVQKGDHKEYVSSVSFGQILSLFYLDKSLRNNVMAAMQDLEEFIKEIIADVLAKSFGTDPENYLKFSNFRDRKTSNTRFSLKSVLRKAKKGLSSDKEPIKHYREKYGCIPPTFWGTFDAHMKRLKKEKNLTNEEMHFRTGFSEKYIRELRKGYKNVSPSTVYALCIGLHLHPYLSDDFIRKGRADFPLTKEGMYYRTLIERHYMEPLSYINEKLEARGYKPWGEVDKIMDIGVDAL